MSEYKYLREYIKDILYENGKMSGPEIMEQVSNATRMDVNTALGIMLHNGTIEEDINCRVCLSDS